MAASAWSPSTRCAASAMTSIWRSSSGTALCARSPPRASTTSRNEPDAQVCDPPRSRSGARAGKRTAMSAFLQRAVERLRAAPRRAAGSAREAPVVIFGTGGSGTRALQVLTDRDGYFMGTNLNRPGDSLDIGQFMRRWLNRYLLESNWVERMRQGSDEGGFGHPR